MTAGKRRGMVSKQSTASHQWTDWATGPAGDVGSVGPADHTEPTVLSDH